jgi:DNA polymerase
MGATAARSLTGRPVAINKLRGTPITLADGSQLVVTIHPSYLLRIREEADKRAEYARFVTDLKHAVALLATPGRRALRG